MTALELIQKEESCELEAYQDIGGTWTVGWGSTGQDVVRGVVWTQAQADQRLTLDVLMIEKDIEELVEVPLTDNQHAALSSFIYNEGYGHFKNSTLLRKLNDKDYAGAADEFLRWNKCRGQVVKALSERRARERALFLT